MIFYDEHAGRMFIGPDEEEINKLQNLLNEKMAEQKYPSVKECLENARNEMREHMTSEQLALWKEIDQKSKDFGWNSFKDAEPIQFDLCSSIIDEKGYMILYVLSTPPL